MHTVRPLALVSEAQATLTAASGISQGEPRAQVVLSVFGDLMCPDTKRAYPTLLDVAAHYGADKLRFVFHPFALPYTHNSFYANQGVYVVREATQNASKVWQFISLGFANQGLFWNHLTMDKTPNQACAPATPVELTATLQIIQQWGGIAEQNGIMSASDYVKGMANISTYMAADFAWKYGTSRAVTGYPPALNVSSPSRPPQHPNLPGE